MRRFNQTCAQGEIGFIKLPRGYEIPKDATKVTSCTTGDSLIIGHSETGHHHVMSKSSSTLYKLPDSILECLLVVTKPDVLRHLRDYDQHEPIQFDPGIYKVKYLREYVPQGFRAVQD